MSELLFIQRLLQALAFPLPQNKKRSHDVNRYSTGLYTEMAFIRNIVEFLTNHLLGFLTQ